MNRIIMLGNLLCGLALAWGTASCEWGFMEAPGDGESEAPDAVDADGAVDTDADPADADLPDAADTDADRVDLDASDPDTADPDLADPVTDDGDAGPECGNGELEGTEQCDDGTANSDTEPDACRTDCTEARCGDGVVDSGEQCDDAGGFCAGCSLTPPTGWSECADGSGSRAFFMVETWAGNHTWSDFRDHCRDMITALSPSGFRYYGLAVLSDQTLSGCVTAGLDTGQAYYLGLYQDTAAGDYGEPDRGWYWIAFNGADWQNLDPYSPTLAHLPGALNDAGGSGIDVECGRMVYVGRWEFQDYPCVDATSWLGLCMIQY
jgi:hypothetical protein